MRSAICGGPIAPNVRLHADRSARRARASLQCVEEVKSTPNPLFRRVEVRVYATAQTGDHLLAELIGILPRRP